MQDLQAQSAAQGALVPETKALPTLPCQDLVPGRRKLAKREYQKPEQEEVDSDVTASSDIKASRIIILASILLHIYNIHIHIQL